MSIGEFAGAVELSVSAVRFYADRSLLIPATTDPSTGYRYFTEDQILRGSLIRDLRLMEMGLAEIEDVLAMTAAARAEAIQEHIRRLENRLVDVRGVAHTLAAAPDRDRDTDAATTLRSADLARAITQVIAAAGRDPRRPQHMCMLIEVRDNSLRCVATDSYRLAVRDLLPASVGRAFSAVVAAAELRSWPEALAASDFITVGLVGETFTAQGSGVDLRCPTIPVSFPDYEPILHASAGRVTTVVADRGQLLAILESFEGDGTIGLTASHAELVASRDGTVRRVDADISGIDTHVALNPRFAYDAVEHAVGSELIIEIDDALRPLTFRSADDGTYTSMLMPVKPDGPRG